MFPNKSRSEYGGKANAPLLSTAVFKTERWSKLEFYAKLEGKPCLADASNSCNSN